MVNVIILTVTNVRIFNTNLMLIAHWHKLLKRKRRGLFINIKIPGAYLQILEILRGIYIKLKKVPIYKY